MSKIQADVIYTLYMKRVYKITNPTFNEDGKLVFNGKFGNEYRTRTEYFRTENEALRCLEMNIENETRKLEDKMSKIQVRIDRLKKIPLKVYSF